MAQDVKELKSSLKRAFGKRERLEDVVARTIIMGTLLGVIGIVSIVLIQLILVVVDWLLMQYIRMKQQLERMD